MTEIEIKAHQYVSGKFPGRTFTNFMAVSMYLEDVLKIPPAKGAVSNKPQIYPKDETKPCPTCGEPMRKFALCTNCSLYKEHGYVSQWICLKSKGVLQKVHTTQPAKEGEVRYSDFLAYSKVDIDTSNLTCSQEGILVKEKDD